MADKKAELLRFAREYATENKDLYELLSVSTDATQPEVQRAWRKASLKHHPDKAKVFDPEIWELLERARDVLSFSEARALYDNARAAAVLAQKARAAIDAKKREMIEDLEARERGIKRKAGEGEANGRHMMTDAEKKTLMETGREHVEKRRKLKEEAAARERERMGMEAGRDKEPVQKEAERRRTHSDFDRSSTASTSMSTPTDNKFTEDKGACHSPRQLPDDYDERIAYLEGRGWEQRAKKAARRAEMEAGRERDSAQRETERQRTQFDYDRIPTTSTSPSASTDYKMTEDTESHPTPSQTLPDDYDERIAYLEGRIRERKAEKATRKADKKNSKFQKDGVPFAGETLKSPTIPPMSRAAAAASPPSKPKTVLPVQTSASKPAAGGGFASTMAKLRAAQKERERKKAGAAGATTFDSSSNS